MNKGELVKKATEVIRAVVCDYQEKDEDGCSLYSVSDYISCNNEPDYKCMALIYTHESYKQVVESIVLAAIELTEDKEILKELMVFLFEHNVRTLYVEGTTHIMQEHIYWLDMRQH